MKIQLNYDSKIVTVEKMVKLVKFIEAIQRILPDWEEWELSTHTEIIWRNTTPIVIERDNWVSFPHFHPYQVWTGTAPNTVASTTQPELDHRESTTPSGVYQLQISWV